MNANTNPRTNKWHIICPVCGHDLFGATSKICSECGTDLTGTNTRNLAEMCFEESLYYWAAAGRQCAYVVGLAVMQILRTAGVDFETRIGFFVLYFFIVFMRWRFAPAYAWQPLDLAPYGIYLISLFFPTIGLPLGASLLLLAALSRVYLATHQCGSLKHATDGLLAEEQKTLKHERYWGKTCVAIAILILIFCWIFVLHK